LELYKLLPLKIEVNNMNQCKEDLESIGLPSASITLLERFNELKIEGEVVLLIHRDPGRYSYFIDGFSGKEPVYIIGRSMYETDSIPSKWISKCNTLVQKIWTPSKFNVETFSKAGVEAEKLEVVPEPIDVYLYDPAVIKPMKLNFKKEFNFLSVMKWEARKGWNLLLKAYFSEFTSKDSVSLYIRSNLDDKNMEEYNSFMQSFLEDNEDLKAEDLPQVIFIRDQLPYSKFPSLYKAVDSVVLATHGEGWGLPLIEGMSMGLPVISTNWSGSTEFMTTENSFLIPVEEMVPATGETGHMWAKVSVTHLQAAMRTVFTDRELGKKMGAKARRDVVANYSQERVARIIVNKLKAVEAQAGELAKKRLEEKEASDKKKKLEEDAKKDKIQIKIIDDVK